MRDNFYRNKNIIITGASGGLGKELSKILYEKGANLFLLVSMNSNISDLDFAKKIYRCDLNNRKDIERTVTTEIFSSVDILINCAGIFPLVSLEDMAIDEYDKVMNINCRAPFILSKGCIASMKNRGGGLIINIGSSSSYTGSSDCGGYCISKHALLGLSRSLTKELKKYNIRVLAFSPGSIKTNMGKTDIRQDFETFLDPKDVAEFILYSATFKNEMIVDESRMNRISIL
jgi:short-subunit dehydrogenase